MAKAKAKKKDDVQTAVEIKAIETAMEHGAEFIEARNALLGAMSPGITVDAANLLVLAFEEAVINAVEAPEDPAQETMAKAKAKKKDAAERADEVQAMEDSRTEQGSELLAARDLLISALVPGITAQEAHLLLLGFEEAVIDAVEAVPVNPPTFIVQADNPFGMKVMVALSHWAASAHDVDADTRRAFREKVREFELWREANQ
jgi:hypothetical protein